MGWMIGSMRNSRMILLTNLKNELIHCNTLVNLINWQKTRGGHLGVSTLLTRFGIPKLEEILLVLWTLSVRSLIVNSFPQSNFNLGTHYPTNNVLMIWPLTGTDICMGCTYYATFPCIFSFFILSYLVARCYRKYFVLTAVKINSIKSYL